MVSEYCREAYCEPCETFVIQLLMKIANDWSLLLIFAKNSIIDLWLGSKNASVVNKKEILKLIEQLTKINLSDGLTRMKIMVPQIVLHPTMFWCTIKTKKNQNQTYLVGKCFSKKKHGKNSYSGKLMTTIMKTITSNFGTIKNTV